MLVAHKNAPAWERSQTGAGYRLAEGVSLGEEVAARLGQPAGYPSGEATSLAGTH